MLIQRFAAVALGIMMGTELAFADRNCTGCKKRSLLYNAENF